MWLILIVIFVALLLYKKSARPRNFPPGKNRCNAAFVPSIFFSNPGFLFLGPPSLPVLGSIPFMKGVRYIHLYMEEAKKKYGPVIGAKIVFTDGIFICGPEEVMEALKIDEFQGRPTFIAIASNIAKDGIILTDGPAWSVRRRFTLRHLRDFGFGKTSLEGAILEEISDFFDVAMYGTNQIQVAHLFNTSAINVLWRLMAGKRYKHDDAEFTVLLKALADTFRQGGFASGKNIFVRSFQNWIGRPAKIECEETMINFIKKSIAEHRETRTEEARDFIDVYLQEMEKENNPDFSELSLISICLDLFSAGAESVGNTLSFCLMYLIIYPELQEEVWKEVNQVLGDRDPSLADRSRLPKVEAFLSEVARINTIAPIAVPRRAMADVTFRGYNVPKDTTIFVSLWCLMKDKKHWGDPEVFRPARFINDEGTYKKDEYMMNFGIGKRQCPGESLAKNTLFLFFVKLIQEFDFSLPEGHAEPDTVPNTGFTQACKPFEVALKRRSKF